jgi:tRNA pseudouridine55 synthase
MGVRPRPVGPAGAAAAAALASFHGWLVLHKPAGLPTRALSNVVLALLRRGTRVGHVGTLDPAAAGVVVLALGRAAKLAPYLDGTKAYAAVVKLGWATATDDATGDVTAVAACGGDGALDGAPLRAAVADALAARFTGAFPQVPPAVSAVKTGGRRAYRVALEGLRRRAAADADAAADDGVGTGDGDDDVSDPSLPLVSLAPKTVTVHALRVDGWCDDDAPADDDDDAAPAGLRGALPHARTWVKDPTAASATPSDRSSATSSSSAVGTQRVAVRVETLRAAAPAPPALVDAAADTAAGGGALRCGFPEVRLSLTVGAGFYVRSLARDVGAAVGVPATLAALTRTRSGGFALADATPLYDLTRGTVLTPPALRPSDAPFLAALPGVVLAPVRQAAPRLERDEHHALMAAAASLRDACAAGSTGTRVAAGGDTDKDAAAQCSGAPSARDDEQSKGRFPLMPSREALATAVHMWNCDTQVAYEGSPLRSDAAATTAPYLVRVYALARHRAAGEVLGGAVVMGVACPAAKAAAAAAAAGGAEAAPSAAAAVPVPSVSGAPLPAAPPPSSQQRRQHCDTEAWWSRAADVGIDAASLAGASAAPAAATAVAPTTAAGDDVVPVFAGLALALPPGSVPSLGAPDRRPRPGSVHLMRVVTMLV